MGNEQIAIELTKIWIEQRNRSSCPFVVTDNNIFEKYIWYLDKLNKKSSEDRK